MLRRRIFPMLVLALVAASCSDAPAPLTPLPDDGALVTTSLTITSAKQTVVDFLNAYAEAPEDGGDALAAVAGSVTLAEWAHWEPMRFVMAGGGFTTTVEVDDIVPIDSGTEADGAPNLILDVNARVRFIHRDEDGSVVRFDRDFSGPAKLIQQGTLAWALTDITRDGGALSRRVIVPTSGTRTAGPVTLFLSSVFNYVPAGVFFNLRITNRTDDRVFVVPSQTGLRFDGVLLRPTERIPLSAALPGEELEFQLFFVGDDPLFSTNPDRLTLHVRLAGWPGAQTFTFPLFGPTDAPEGEPTADPTGEPTVAAGTPMG